MKEAAYSLPLMVSNDSARPEGSFLLLVDIPRRCKGEKDRPCGHGAVGVRGKTRGGTRVGTHGRQSHVRLGVGV